MAPKRNGKITVRAALKAKGFKSEITRLVNVVLRWRWPMVWYHLIMYVLNSPLPPRVVSWLFAVLRAFCCGSGEYFFRAPLSPVRTFSRRTDRKSLDEPYQLMSFLAFKFPVILAYSFAPFGGPVCSDFLLSDSLCTRWIAFCLSS